MGQFGRHGQLAEKPPCLVQMPRCDAGARLHGVDTNRAHAAFEHMEQRRQSCRVVGDLAGHVAHVEQFAAGGQHRFDLVMKHHPCRLGLGREFQHGRRKRALIIDGHRPVQDRGQPIIEGRQRRPVRWRFCERSHALRRSRPRHQEAGQKPGAACQPLGAVEEGPQGGFLHLQRHREPGAAHGEAFRTAPLHWQGCTVPQLVQRGQVAHDRILAHAVTAEHAARLAADHATGRPLFGQCIGQRLGRGIAVDQTRDARGLGLRLVEVAQFAFLHAAALAALSLRLDLFFDTGALRFPDLVVRLIGCQDGLGSLLLGRLIVADAPGKKAVTGRFALTRIGDGQQEQGTRPGQLFGALCVVVGLDRQ